MINMRMREQHRVYRRELEVRLRPVSLAPLAWPLKEPAVDKNLLACPLDQIFCACYGSSGSKKFYCYGHRGDENTPRRFAPDPWRALLYQAGNREPAPARERARKTSGRGTGTFRFTCTFTESGIRKAFPSRPGRKCLPGPGPASANRLNFNAFSTSAPWLTPCIFHLMLIQDPGRGSAPLSSGVGSLCLF